MVDLFKQILSSTETMMPLIVLLVGMGINTIIMFAKNIIAMKRGDETGNYEIEASICNVEISIPPTLKNLLNTALFIWFIVAFKNSGLSFVAFLLLAGIYIVIGVVRMLLMSAIFSVIVSSRIKR